MRRQSIRARPTALRVAKTSNASACLQSTCRSPPHESVAAHSMSWILLQQFRQCSSSTTTISSADVEWVDADSFGDHSRSAERELRHVDVKKIDSFSRARVINFVKRFSSQKDLKSDDIFITAEFRLGSHGLTAFRSRVLVPHSQAPEGHITAEGISSNSKDAELLAAMHAEQIIDACGLPIYTLGSMQRKHAEAARSQGRWAPLPGDSPKHFSDVKIPNPLQRIQKFDETEDGEWLLVDTTIDQFRPNPVAIISPCIYDRQALSRLRQLFSDFGLVLDAFLVIREEVRSPGTPADEPTWFTCKISLPSAWSRQASQERILGKATDRMTAMHLAAMHAELVMDSMGVSLFRDATSQDLHAKAVIGYGRRAQNSSQPSSGNPASSPLTSSLTLRPPPGLKQLYIPSGTNRISTRSAEEEWARAHLALSSEAADFESVTEKQMPYFDMCVSLISNFMRNAATVPSVACTLKTTTPYDLFRHETYLTQILGSKFIATLLLPLSSEFGVRGGVGLAATTSEAKKLAAAHAVDVLHALHIDVTLGDSAKQKAMILARAAAGLPPMVPKADHNRDPAVRSPPALRLDPAPINPESVSQGSHPTVLKIDIVNFKEYQKPDTRELWDLTPDFNDYIVVTDPEKTTRPTPVLVHSTISPRKIDRGAIDRAVVYLAGVGKRFGDVCTTVVHVSSTQGMSERRMHSTGISLTEYRSVIRIPLPAAFGDRLAIGVASTPKEAETVAAMHMELVLDTLGIPIFSKPYDQLTHAEAVRKLGRYAPYPKEAEPKENAPHPSTPSPPHLRKVTREEIGWIRMVQSRKASTRSGPSPSQTDVTSRAVQETAATPGKTSGSHAVPPAAAQTSPLGIPDKLTYIPVGMLDPVCKDRFLYYLRCHRRPIDSSIMKVHPFMLDSVNMHMCELDVPVPKKFGQRKAIGVAGSVRNAEILMFMHAERIIDGLGIHLFNLPGMQTRHAQRVVKLGRWAPMPTDKLELPGNTPSPRPLSLGDANPRPAVPVCPGIIDVNSAPSLWAKYIKDCEFFIEAVTKYEQHIAFDEERCPRTGEALIDETLDEVENNDQIIQDAKHTLQQYCSYSGHAFPIFWKTIAVGSLTRRLCYTTVPVPGHEYIIARGVALTKENSTRRAAMHILAILRRIDPDFVEFEANPALREKQNSVKAKGKHASNVGSWDSKLNTFTTDGKIRAIEMYSVCLGLQPPCVINKQRIDGKNVTHITSVELVDEDGKLWEGRSDEAGKRGNTTVAYDDLFQKLLDGAPSFRSLTELIQKHPHLDPEHVVDISFSPEIRDRIKKILDAAYRERSHRNVDDDTNEAVTIVNHAADDATPIKHAMGTIDAEESKYRSEELRQRYLAKLASPVYLEIFAPKRKNLSIHEHRETIIDTIRNHQVTIICGTTGCGKTTQIPQYILDDATERGHGGDVSMIVTQPRRLSAVSIAQRIASERLEKIGDACGYTIRLDSKPGRHITFVTSGVLLRLFHASPTLEGINYVIIDEIHERDINSDFLLILVRDLIRTRKDLRVILMSATLSSDQFAKFFDNAPVINIVGYVHPVQEFFLADLALSAKKRNRMTPLLHEVVDQIEKDEIKAAQAELERLHLSSITDTEMDDEDIPRLCIPREADDDEKQRAALPTSKTTQKYGFLEASGEIDYMAVQFAADFSLEQLDIKESSVLIFLPGWDEIVKAKEVLSRNSKYHIITLHSSVSADEQLMCFQPPPEGKVKLILSTNIAESGVTIDDIAVVIDVGRAKEKSYVMRRGRTTFGRNEMGSMSQLVTVYASRANCVQRRGRVGRTRPGICIRMYTKQHFNSLHDFQTPEMLRQPLDALCLQILALGLGDPIDFLQQAIEPPTIVHVESAMRRLHELGAVTAKGLLTPLGLHLAKLPVTPRVGKMILVGAALRCLDTALTIAACSDTDVYNSSREVRDAVKAHREDLSNNTLSDHISSVNGFNLWVTSHFTKSPQEVMLALNERQLSVPQLLTVSRYKEQFFEILCNHGFIPEAQSIAKERAMDRSCRGDIFVEKSMYSADATHVGLVKCVVGACLFPNIAMHRGKKLMRTKLDNRLSPAGASVIAQHETLSLNDSLDSPSPYFVFEEVVQHSIEKTMASRLVLRGLTSVPLWAVVLMGTSSMPVTYREDLNLGIIDEWILFRASFSTLELIRNFKQEFHRCLTRKFAAPNDARNDERLNEFREIIKALVSTPIRPNELVATKWEEKGTIIEPITVVQETSESAFQGDTQPAGEHPHAADDDES